MLDSRENGRATRRRLPVSGLAGGATLLVATFLAAPEAVSQEAPAAVREASTPGTFHSASYADEAGERSYRLYGPAAPVPEKGRPLLVYLHGCTQDGADAATGTRLNERAEERGMLVLYPEQPDRVNPNACWQWYDAAQRDDGPEMSLVSGMIDRILAEHPVDRDRIYVAGISAGGAMALALVAARPDLFAAVGSHSGVPYTAAMNEAEGWSALGGSELPIGNLASRVRAEMGEVPPKPIPLIVFQGADDPLVKPVNAGLTVQLWLAIWGHGTGEAVPPDRTVADEVEGRSFERSFWTMDGHTVAEMWVVDGLSHALSGGSPDGTYADPQGPDAIREMLRFFKAAVE